MRKYSLAYNHIVGDYFNPEADSKYTLEDGYIESQEIQWKNEEKYLSLFGDLKKIIKKNMQNILGFRVKFLNNNDGLVEELNTAIETIDNGIDFDFTHGRNFAFMTDNYLCFNNYENYVDKSTLDSLGSDAATSETIVVIDTRLRSFYFLRTTKAILSQSKSTIINAYYIKENDITKTSVNLDGGIDLPEHTDEGIRQLLSSLEQNKDSQILL